MNAVNRMKTLTRSKMKLFTRVDYNVINVKIAESFCSLVTCSQGAFPIMRLLRLHRSASHLMPFLFSQPFVHDYHRVVTAELCWA